MLSDRDLDIRITAALRAAVLKTGKKNSIDIMPAKFALRKFEI